MGSSLPPVISPWQQRTIQVTSLASCSSAPRVAASGLLASIPRQHRASTPICQASSAKKLEKVGANQLQEAERIANKGEDEEQDNRKGPASDRAAELGQGFEARATEKFEKAVSITRGDFDRIRRKASSADEGQENVRPQLRQLGEEGKAAIRNARRKLMQELGRLERDSRISSDEQHILENTIQKATDDHIAQIDAMIDEKTAKLINP